MLRTSMGSSLAHPANFPALFGDRDLLLLLLCGGALPDNGDPQRATVLDCLGAVLRPRISVLLRLVHHARHLGTGCVAGEPRLRQPARQLRFVVLSLATLPLALLPAPRVYRRGGDLPALPAEPA